MKKLFLIVAAVFAAVSFLACSDDDDNGDGSNLACPALPDPNDVCSCMDDFLFMDYCYTLIDINKDGKVSKAEAEAVKTIDFTSQNWSGRSEGLKSLKGIGYFVNLEKLVCSCTSLTEVDLRQNKKLASINFYGCETLEHIALPDGLTTIESFVKCTSLTSITIPNGVTSIEIGTFSGCYNLDSFKGKFATSDNRCLITYDGTLVAFASAGLTEYTIPKGVTSIDYAAFLGSCLETVTFEKGSQLKSISDAFYSCEELMEVDMSACTQVTKIGEYSFVGTNVLLFKIGTKVPPSLGRDAFEEDRANSVLKVPAGCVDAYRNSKWGLYFKNISELDE